ncbi:MAG TPA: outer membrane beta-barrel protein [Candidatus Cryosericum sp.]|nr:outer membrane beta-barrel protein [Candidatus Cryosericum sp.]
MIKYGRLALLAAVLSLTPVSQALCAGDVLFLLGQRNLDSDAEPVEDQDAYGVFGFFRQDDWPISFSMGFESSDSGEVNIGGIAGTSIGNVEVKGEITEGYIGVGKVFEKSGKPIRPYATGGITVLGIDVTYTELTTDTDFDDDDTVIAPYIGGGVFWRLGKRFDVGAGIRYVFFAETTLQPFEILAPQEADINFLQYHALIGWGW